VEEATITGLSLGHGDSQAWDTILVPDVPHPAIIDVTCVARVPPSLSRELQTLALSLEGPDGRDVATYRETVQVVVAGGATGAHVEMRLEVDWEVTLPSYGRYGLVAGLQGQRGAGRRVEFEVRQKADTGAVISEEEQNFFDEEMGLLD